MTWHAIDDPEQRDGTMPTDDPRLTEKRVDDIKVALIALKFLIDMQSGDYPMAREILAYERLRELPL